MAPPDYPGIPTSKLPRRPQASRPSVEVIEEMPMSDADTVKAFHSRGKIGVTIGANVIVAAITAGLTWLASHHESSPANCASREQLDQLSHQIDQMHQDLGALASHASASEDRTHNDIELLKVRIEALRGK